MCILRVGLLAHDMNLAPVCVWRVYVMCCVAACVWRVYVIYMCYVGGAARVSSVEIALIDALQVIAWNH